MEQIIDLYVSLRNEPNTDTTMERSHNDKDLSVVELSLKRLTRINEFIRDTLSHHTRLKHPITPDKIKRSGITLHSSEEYLFQEIFNESPVCVEYWLEQNGRIIGEKFTLSI